MSSRNPSMLNGRCHCGNVTASFETSLALADMHPRACDCSFCCKHGAAWISDPAGKLRIEAQEQTLLSYRQGSGQVQFLMCGNCGVLVAVVLEHSAGRFGAVNASCLEGVSGLGEATVVSPQLLDASGKEARWKEVWVPDVEVVVKRA